MQEYKKRVRLLAERLGASIDYTSEGGLTLSTLRGRICFAPISKAAMSCAVKTWETEVTFECPKACIFDIIQRLNKGQPLEVYKPNGMPLTLQEYMDEEHAGERISELVRRVSAGTAKNEEVGGNHYNAEYYNGILIFFDIFTDAPANVVDFTCCTDTR